MRNFCLFLLLLLPLCATDEIRVQLSTETPLQPLYIASWEGEAALQKVFAFDFNHNGRTQVVSDSTERRRLAKEGSYDGAAWRKAGVLYVVQGKKVEGRLSIAFFSAITGERFHSGEVELTGELAKDRRKIHQVADAIHEKLYGKPGIASSHLLYMVKAVNTDKGMGEIWMCDYDGANSHQITFEGGTATTPSFLPTQPGKMSPYYTYVSYRSGQPKICLASVYEKKEGRPLVTLKGQQLMPALTPQRDCLLFVSDAAGNPDLFSIAFDPLQGPLGKPRQLYSAPRGAQASPTTSPDGRRIAFVSNKDGAPRIYLLNLAADGSALGDPVCITAQNRENTSPAWSPDGSKIAYSSMAEGTRQIWLYDLNEGTERPLTTGPGHKENPCWASDSLHLVFNSADKTTCQLYLVNLNQPKAVAITSGAGEKRFPSFGS
ncbi:MAG: Tol-Pal system protein TolB [Parachlamydiales bacterium]